MHGKKKKPDDVPVPVGERIKAWLRKQQDTGEIGKVGGGVLIASPALARLMFTFVCDTLQWVVLFLVVLANCIYGFTELRHWQDLVDTLHAGYNQCLSEVRRFSCSLCLCFCCASVTTPRGFGPFSPPEFPWG
jgi:hypothetical protein